MIDELRTERLLLRPLSAPAGPDDTTHLDRLIFADRALDDDTLEAVIALG